MIKTVLRIILLFAVLPSCKGQQGNAVLHQPNFIDSIHTALQLQDLIVRVDNRYKDFKINTDLKSHSKYSRRNYKKTADSLHVQPWTKADFDHNGLTDILIIGNWYDYCVICILDKGDKYELKRITRRSFQESSFPVVENNNINYYYESEPDPADLDKPRQLEQITLTYKSGDFVEENKKPATHQIEKIEYSTSGCLGFCPVFNLTINADRTSTWFANMYNDIDKKEMKGHFQTVITKEKYDELVGLLNYIDFENLKNKYSVDWTDDQSCILKITYDNGRVKTISDYGLIGTYGLDRVYQLLFELRINQQWKK